MVEINDKAKKIDLFDGLNVHPVPLDFTNSLTTTEFLFALQNKVNELVETWNTSFEKIKEYTKEEQNRIIEIVSQSIENLNTEIRNLINSEITETEEKIETNKTELTENINNIKSELLERIVALESILNLISNGESIDLSELYNNYSEINLKYKQIENDFRRIQEKFTSLKNSVEEFTNDVAICQIFPQEEIETPETLINDNIESLAFTYSSAKIERLLSNIKTEFNTINNIINQIGNTNAQNRDEINTIRDMSATLNRQLIETEQEIYETINNIRLNDLQEMNQHFENEIQKIKVVIKKLHKNSIIPW